MHRFALDDTRVARARMIQRMCDQALIGERVCCRQYACSRPLSSARVCVLRQRVDAHGCLCHRGALQVEMRLPTLEEAAAFCVESGPAHPAPFATHKPWRHRPLHELSALVAACPELAPLAALTGVVLP
jgi:hypothetical protein